MAQSNTSLPPSVADEWRASCLSQLLFSWMYPLLQLGASRPLERSDLGVPPLSDRVTPHAERFEAAWRGGGGDGDGGAPRGTRAVLTRVFWSRMRKGAASKAFADLCGYAQIFAVKAVVTYAEGCDGGGDGGWPARALFGGGGGLRVVDLAVVVLFVCPALQGVGNHWFYHHVMIDGVHARSALKARAVRARRVAIS
jgi:hypothetical protein